MVRENTPYIGLIKPDPSDQYNIKDFNDNADTIDSRVKLIEDNALTKVNKDFSNLTEEAEKHFLNKSQITNCLKEIPQRIKYTLVDGVLTILKGSVCIVPYGTEDKTADLPKGATFINENFRVYDTQYTEDSDGKDKFFVWAELVEDIVNKLTESQIKYMDNSIYLLGIRLPLNKFCSRLAGNQHESGSSDLPTYEHAYYYNTTANKVDVYFNSALEQENCTFPIGLVQKDDTGWVAMKQIFNGMGYIGSTVWADKGVKGLIPDGRNEDGSLKNIEQTIDKLVTLTCINWTTNVILSYELADGNNATSNSIAQNSYFNYYETVDMPATSAFKWFDKINNIQYYHDANSTLFKSLYRVKNLVFARATFSNGKIQSLQPNFAFRAADENDLDGMWNKTAQHIINSLTSLTAGASSAYIDYDISSYLPNDGCVYEVLLEILGQAGAATNLFAHYWVSDAVTSGQACSCGARSYSTVGALFYGNGILPMHSRTLRLNYSSSAGVAPTISVLRLAGYRKVR